MRRESASVSRVPPCNFCHAALSCRSVRKLSLILLSLFCIVGCDDRGSDRTAPSLSGPGSGFPTKPIKVVVPFSPGGGSDTFARAVQSVVHDHALLPERLVIVNRPGAGGTIGSRSVKNAFPDGHTILFLHDAIVTARHAGQATYGPDAFEPIAGTGELGAVIAVGPDSEFDSLQKLMQAASRQPETIPFAANLGAPSHFWALLLEKASPDSSARFRFVQSGGGALRFGDLKGGHVAASAFSVAELLQFESDGLRALAYLGEQRHPALPEVPTAREQGIDVVAGNLQSWWAPKGTPPERVATLAAALATAMKSESLLERMKEWQIEPEFLDAGQLKSEIRRRDQLASEVAARKLPELPNLPLWTLVATLVLASLSYVGRTKTDAPSAEHPVPGGNRKALSSMLTMLGLTLMTIALWQVGRIGIHAVAFCLVIGAGVLLRERISGLNLITLGIIALSLALTSNWLFKTLLGVDL